MKYTKLFKSKIVLKLLCPPIENDMSNLAIKLNNISNYLLLIVRIFYIIFKYFFILKILP